MADKKISQLTGATTPLAGTEVLPIVQGGSTVKVSAANITAGRAVQAASLDLNGGSSTGGAIVSGSVSSIRASSTVIDQGDGSRILALGANPSTLAVIKLIAATSDASQYNYIAESDSSSNFKVTTGNLVVGTAGKGIDFSANANLPGMTSEVLDWYEEGTWVPTDGSGGGLTFTVDHANYTRIGNLVTVNAYITYPVTASTANTNITLPFTALKYDVGMARSSNGAVGCAITVGAASRVTFRNNSLVTLTNADVSGADILFSFTYTV